MSLLDYLVLGGIAAVIILIIMWIIRRKKRGEGGCGYCPYKGNCVNKSCEGVFKKDKN